MLDGHAEAADLGPQIQVHHSAVRRGPAVMRNWGASYAQGDVIFFVDADVEVHEGAVERVRDFFAEQKGDAVFGCYDDSPSEPELTSRFRNLLHHYVHWTNAGPAATFWAGCGAIKKNVFIQSGGFDENYRLPSIEDIELGVRLANKGHRIILDADLQGKHLKQWPLLAMWQTDLLQRAVPWSRLILSSAQIPQGLNTPWAARIAVAAQGLTLVTAAAACSISSIIWLSLLCQVLAVLCHGGFLTFLSQRYGRLFALRCVPLLIAYNIICGTGFIWASMIHLLERLIHSIQRSPQPTAMIKSPLENEVV
jgi:glycosyltransferase involved in cell wall biosynthesis